MKNGYEKFFKEAGQAKRDQAKPSGAPQTIKKQSAAHKLNRKKAPPFPLKALGGLVVSIGLVAGYLLYPDFLPDLVDRIEISFLGQAGASDKPAEKSSKGEKPAANGGAHGAAATTDHSPDPATEVKNDISHYSKLKQRKEELDAREKELAELEEELQRQKVELDKRLQQLEETRNQIAQILKERVEVDQEKVNKLVDLYSNMKAKQAADLLGSINEDLAVEVLAKMKKKNAAEIMNLLPAEKAKTLSEKYTGYRRAHGEPKG